MERGRGRDAQVKGYNNTELELEAQNVCWWQGNWCGLVTTPAK